MRPLTIRKKRCFTLCCILICITVTLSWMLMNGKISRTAELVNSRSDGNSVFGLREHFTIKDPKLHVLDKPPLALPPKFVNEDIKDVNNEPGMQSRNKSSDGEDLPDEYQKDNRKSDQDESKIPNYVDKTINNSSKFLNKSKDLEIAKNKTLAQLSVLGKENNGALPKMIIAQSKWNLSVSFADIGNVMKDTEYFNKLRPLDLRGPLLQSTKNRTANFSLSMPMKVGYCDCWELHCFCCAQLVNKQLHLNVKSCSNFTFISKSHELDLTFSIDGKFVHRQVLSADSPPLLCMRSVPAVVDICVHFSNMTYRVDRMSMHKSQILGCTDFSFVIFNKTINAFPVDCFQIPGDPNHHPKHEQLILPNFVP